MSRDAVRARALEVVGVAGSERVAFAVHRQLELAANHDATLLSLVVERHLAGVGARCVAFDDHLQLALAKIRADLPVADGTTANLRQFGLPIHDFGVTPQLEREEIA